MAQDPPFAEQVSGHLHQHVQKAKHALNLNYGERPWGLTWRSNTFFIIATVGIGLFTDLFLYGLIVPVLPYLLEDRIGITDPGEQQHLVSGLLAAYAGASVFFSPIAGFIADRTETRQLPFLVGLVALLLATVLLSVGNTIPILVVARLLQGMSAAVVWTIGLALCIDTVGPENLGKTIGTIFSFISVGQLAAPVVGGALYSKSGFTGVFAVGAGILVVDFTMRLLVIEKRTAKKYDNGGSRLNGDGNDDAEAQNDDDETSPLIGKNKEHYKLNPPPKAFLRKIPIMYCLKNSSLLTSFLTAFMQATLLGVFDATITTETRDLFNFDSLGAGLLFVPLGVGDAILGPIAGWAVDKYGTKPVGTTGFAYLVPILISLRAVNSGGKDQLILYCALLVLSGLGLAVIGAPSIVEAGSVIQKYHKANLELFGENGPYAQLYGFNCMVFSAGLTLGPLIGGSLREKIGYGNMNAVVAAMCFVTAVACYFFLGGKPRAFLR